MQLARPSAPPPEISIVYQSQNRLPSPPPGSELEEGGGPRAATGGDAGLLHQEGQGARNSGA